MNRLEYMWMAAMLLRGIIFARLEVKRCAAKQMMSCPYSTNVSFPQTNHLFSKHEFSIRDLNLNRQNWDSAFKKKKPPYSVNLCVHVRVCPLSLWGIAALQPATTADLLSAFSPAPVSSRHAITLSNETGENASQAASFKHTVPESITSLSLSVHGSISLQFIPAFIQIGLYNMWQLGGWV